MSMVDNHLDPLITCPFCKTVLFCDMAGIQTGVDIEVYDTCENTNCRSTFRQITFKNYVIGFEFYVGKFYVQLKYKVPYILRMPEEHYQKNEIAVYDWYGIKIFNVDDLFLPDFSDPDIIEERINKFVSFT